MTPLKAYLTRTLFHAAGTFGTFTLDRLAFPSLELPWNDNQTDISCIRPGVYRLEWCYSPHLARYCYLVTGTAPRTGIRVHSANFAGVPSPPLLKQLNGCITLGESVGVLAGQPAVLRSVSAIRKFEDYAAKRPILLEVMQHD